jgi:putative flippase GtrA
VRAGLDPTIARVPAVALAIAVTWYINRRLVFASTDARWFAELLRYYSVSAASAAINYAVFLGVLVALSAWGMARTATFPVLVAALSGSGVAAFATYILAGRFAFHRSPGES